VQKVADDALIGVGCGWGKSNENGVVERISRRKERRYHSAANFRSRASERLRVVVIVAALAVFAAGVAILIVG
jgi:hypothetical protein